MVQMEPSSRYDGLMDKQGSEGSDSLREGVQAAAKSLVESLNVGLKQIAEAAESLAREKMQVIDAVAAKVERWGAEAREMAGMAAQAASEAKEASKQMQAARAAEQEQLQAQAQELITAARVETSEAVRASNEALVSAKQAAEEARSAALVAAAQATEAKNASARMSADPHTQELVDRLEADYRLLTELVQNLHARIAGLGETQREPGSSPYAEDYDTLEPEAEANDPERAWKPTPLEPPRRRYRSRRGPERRNQASGERSCRTAPFTPPSRGQLRSSRR